MAPVNIFKSGADEEKAETARLVSLASVVHSSFTQRNPELMKSVVPLASVVVRGSDRHRRPGEEHPRTQGDGG